MIGLFYLLIATMFFFLSVAWLSRIRSSFRWLNSKTLEKQTLRLNISSNDPRFFILIPVLDEVGTFEKTVSRFSKILQKFPGSRVIIITTEEEYTVNERNSEKDSVVISSYLSGNLHNVISIHYPLKGGKMAHQVNYAVSFIKKHFSIHKGDLFALYNADSQPNTQTFFWVWDFLDKHPKKSGIRIFQQYGDYFGNYSDIKNSGLCFFKKSILISAGLWQNRWSIGFEMPHALCQKRKNRILNMLFSPINYCIGHGLFFSLNAYEKIKGFSQETHNEDAIFGLKLNYYEIPITPIPFFDKSHSPNNLKGLFFQKASWFFGPLEAFEYYQKIIKEDQLIDKFRLLILSVKLFSHAIYWIFGPLFLLILFILAFLLEKDSALIAWILVFLAFLVIPNVVSWVIIRGKLQEEKMSDILIFSLAGSLFFYMLHGASAWFSLFRYLKKMLLGVKIKKQKTIMTNT